MEHVLFKRYLELKLSPERYQHSLDVMDEMHRAAEIYKLDRVLAEVAGLLHDAAKEIPFAAQVSWLERDDPQCLTRLGNCVHEVYLHGHVGAFLVEQALGVKIPELLDAIRFHAGDYEDDKDGKLMSCLHVADVLAPVKEYRGIRKLKAMFYAGNLDGSILLTDTWVKEFFAQINVPLHEVYEKRIERLTKRLDPPPSFFARE